MIVRCDTCHKEYEDVYHLTYCPHDYFEMNTYAVRSDGEAKLCHSIREVEAFLKSSYSSPNLEQKVKP